jgi:hypothetical protein
MKFGTKILIPSLLYLLVLSASAQSSKIIYPHTNPNLLSKNKVKEVLILEGPDQKIVEHYFFNNQGIPYKWILEDAYSQQAGAMIQEITWDKDSTLRQFIIKRVKPGNQEVEYSIDENYYSHSGKLLMEKREQKYDVPTLAINKFDTLNAEFINQINYYFHPDYSDTLKRIINYKDDKSGLYLLEEKINGRWMQKQKLIHQIKNGIVIHADEYENAVLKRSYDLPEDENVNKRKDEDNNPLPFNDQPKKDTIVTKDIRKYANFVHADQIKQYKVIITYQIMDRNKVESYQIINAKTELLIEINYPDHPLSGRKFEYH